MKFESFTAYRNAWDSSDKIDPPVPLNIDLELAALCNLSCGSCSWGEAEFSTNMLHPANDGHAKKRLMPTEMAMRLIDESDDMGVPAIKLNFKGESTLHRDFTKIAEYAATKNFHEILLNTNGNCSEKAIDGMMSCTKVMVSLDAVDPELYPRVRTGGDYKTVIRTISELIRRKHKNLWIRRVVGILNKDEDFVSGVKTMFGKDVKVSEHFAFDRNKDFKVSVHGDNTAQWERQYCTYPSVRLIVTAYGYILPCCIMWGDEYVIGEYPGMSLAEAWKSSKLLFLRDSLRKNNLKNAPEICKNCTSFMAFKRPERRFVQDVEGKANLDSVNTKTECLSHS